MRHLKRGRKLNRTPTHKKAMLRNLVRSLFLHGKVTTSPAKAKEARPLAEKLITLAKDGSLHARRRAISLLSDQQVVGSLFSEIGPRYAERHGGYCRILHLEKTRLGDRGPLVLFELVEGGTPAGSKSTPKTAAPVGPAVPSEPTPAPEAAAEESTPAEADAEESTTPAEEEAPADESAEEADDADEKNEA